MKHEKLLTNFKQTIGKTVAAVDVCYENGWIRFADGTAIVWRASGDEDGADMWVNTDPLPSQLKEAELITADELEAAKEKAGVKYRFALFSVCGSCYYGMLRLNHYGVCADCWARFTTEQRKAITEDAGYILPAKPNALLTLAAWLIVMAVLCFAAFKLARHETRIERLEQNRAVTP